MKQGVLLLEAYDELGNQGSFRTVIKTQHGRVMFLTLTVSGTDCTITDCFYTDRNQNRGGAAHCNVKPLKLQTFRVPKDKLLSVVETELDRKFSGLNSRTMKPQGYRTRSICK